MDDLLSLIIHVIHTPSIRGPVNATAPYPVPNASFTGTLGRVLERPTLIPVPGLAVQALFGEMGKEMPAAGAESPAGGGRDNGFRVHVSGTGGVPAPSIRAGDTVTATRRRSAAGLHLARATGRACPGPGSDGLYAGTPTRTKIRSISSGSIRDSSYIWAASRWRKRFETAGAQ